MWGRRRWCFFLSQRERMGSLELTQLASGLVPSPRVTSTTTVSRRCQSRSACWCGVVFVLVLKTSCKQALSFPISQVLKQWLLFLCSCPVPSWTLLKSGCFTLIRKYIIKVFPSLPNTFIILSCTTDSKSCIQSVFSLFCCFSLNKLLVSFKKK